MPSMSEPAEDPAGAAVRRLEYPAECRSLTIRIVYA